MNWFAMLCDRCVRPYMTQRIPSMGLCPGCDMSPREWRPEFRTRGRLVKTADEILGLVS